MEKMRFETKNITDENIQKILELFPNVATEGVNDNGEIVRAIDFEKLKQELSEVVVDGEESYDFTWVGKKEAMVEANRPIRKTLRPDRKSSVDWENTQNIYIEGDNLEALKLLQESYLGKVKMIYIDPPYNTGNDFVYRDNFTQDKNSYNGELGINDEEGNRLFQNTESNGRFHSDWCSMIYSRLKLARNLLSDDGVIFISIADTELSNLTKICEEVFSKNNIEVLVWKKKGGAGNTEKIIGVLTEYIICCFKDKKPFDLNYQEFERTYKFCDEKGSYNLEGIEKTNLGTYERKTMLFAITDPVTNEKFYPSKDMRWTLGEDTVQQLLNQNKLFFDYSTHKVKRIKRVEDYELSQNVYYNLLTEEGSLASAKDECFELLGNREIFDTPKPTKLLKKLQKISTQKNSIILDFFSGSATTAHAVMQLNAEDGGNRKFIMIQLPEKTDVKSEAYKAGYPNICEIGKERIRRAGKKIQSENPDKKIDIGFRVFKVDDTNMNDVYYTPSELHQTQLGLLESNIKSDRIDEDLLYGCLLDWGVELSLPHKVEIIEGKRVHIVDEDALVACFEDQVPESVMRKIAEMKPTRVVFRDSSFTSDDNKINVEEIFKLISPETTVKVI